MQQNRRCFQIRDLAITADMGSLLSAAAATIEPLEGVQHVEDVGEIDVFVGRAASPDPCDVQVDKFATVSEYAAEPV